MASADCNPTPPTTPILSYSSINIERTARVGSYGSAIEAAYPAAQLESEGIFCEVLNSNVNGLGMPYSGMSNVELHVLATDADAAREILARSPDDLEPVDDLADAPPILGDDGLPLHLVAAAAFENMREFRDAASVLASAQLRIYPPTVRPRGDRPRGQGKRFILKVAEPDVERAKALLEEARVDAEADDEPRCPQCGSWRIHPVSLFWRNVKAFWGMGQWPQKQIECLACHYRGSPEDFRAVT